MVSHFNLKFITSRFSSFSSFQIKLRKCIPHEISTQFLFDRLRNNRSRLEGKPINPFALGNTIPSINPTTTNPSCVVVGGGSSTSSSSASQGTTNLSGSHSLSTGGSSMVTTSLVNAAQQHYSIMIHFSLSDKPFVYDTLAPKMISDLTPSEESSTLLLQGEKKRQICFQQQTDTKSKSEGKSMERNLMVSESVIVVASEHYMKTNNSNNELKTITERICTGPNKKPLVVIALESSTAQTLRHTTSLKASNILVWGSPNFWQNVSRNLMTKYQTFNNNKLHNLSLSSPNKKKGMMGSDDDEIWTYLKTNADHSSNGKDVICSDNSTNRLSMGTLKENLNTRGHQNSFEDKCYNFNFPSSTLQLGKRKQYLRGNPIPSSTPTSRRTSHPDSTETTSSVSSKSRSPNTSKVESHHTMFPSRNILENPFESHKPERFSHRKPPPYPTNQNHGVNSNSDSDYMSVNDSLAPKNEPIYHTLDDEQHQQHMSFNKPMGQIDPNDDQKVYINSALEVVYPTESLLRRQQQKLLELQRQHQYLKQKQRDYQSLGLENDDLDDGEEEEVDEEFDELLGNNIEDGYTDEDQEDVYENGDDNSISYYRHGMAAIQRKPSTASTNYVPSPAPGSYPRNKPDRDLNGFIAMRDPYDSLFQGGSNIPRKALYNSQKGTKKGHKKGSYFV